uniref:Uncharacterized protein n=1 Tax=Anguilla anguilla TaxID=7936 RepID=A0A0E9SSS1_ANGAN
MLNSSHFLPALRMLPFYSRGVLL